MGNQSTGAMPLGTKLEYAVKWGLPVSPLFLMILMMLAHAPYATPIIEPGLFYLMCMAGAFVGFGACALVRSWNHHVSQFACWFGGILLEGAWITLLYGEHGTSFAAVAFGSFLVGVSSGCLLVLCLCSNQTGDVVCEVAKLAVGFAIAFSLYSLFSIMPHGGAISYLFPLATCIPLSMRLHTEPLDRLATPSCKAASAQIDATRRLAASLLLVSFGAGFAVLGFGGQFVEQGAGLAALLLVGCILVRAKHNPLSPLRQSAMPLVVFALCYDALFDSGNPFAFFLAGCGALVIWLYLAPRFDGTRLAPVAPRILALLLAWIIAAAGVGMGIAYFTLRIVDTESYRFSVALVVAVVLADFLWRAFFMTPSACSTEQQAPARRLTAHDVDLLERRFGLSPRECQVVALLCENRSVAYICSTLDLAASTAKTHVRHIYEKTGVHSRSELQLLAEKMTDAGGACQSGTHGKNRARGAHRRRQDE